VPTQYSDQAISVTYFSMHVPWLRQCDTHFTRSGHSPSIYLTGN